MAKNWLFQALPQKSPIFLHFYARRGRGIGRFCPEIGQNRHISEKSQKYMQKVTLFLAFFTALVEKSNFRHRSTNFDASKPSQMPHFLAFFAPLGEKSNIRQISTRRKSYVTHRHATLYLAYVSCHDRSPPPCHAKRNNSSPAF